MNFGLVGDTNGTNEITRRCAVMSHGGARRGGEPGLLRLSSQCMPNACQRRDVGTAHRKQAYQQHGNRHFLLQNVYLQAELANPYIPYFSWPVHTPLVLVGQSTQPALVIHFSVVQSTHTPRVSVVHSTHAPSISVAQSTHTPSFSCPVHTTRVTVVQSTHPAVQLFSPQPRFSCPVHTPYISVVQSTHTLHFSCSVHTHPAFQLSSPHTPRFSCPVHTHPAFQLSSPHTPRVSVVQSTHTPSFSCPVHTTRVTIVQSTHPAVQLFSPQPRFICPVHTTDETRVGTKVTMP
jgi:hypothetical protein